MIRGRRNIGIAVLKIYMLFMIVVCHFIDGDSINGMVKPFVDSGGAAVPVFFFVSFYYFNIRNYDELLNRFNRLLIPQCFFSIGSFLLYLLIPLNNKIVIYVRDKISFWDLLVQLVFGASLDPPLWFFVDMIWVTMILGIGMLIPKRNISFLIVILTVAVYLQYSGHNYRIFQELPSYMKWTCGRFAELIPISVIGILAGRYNVLERMKDKYRITGICVSVVWLYLLKHYSFFTSVDGFYYQGLYFLVYALAITTLFYCLPFELLPSRIQNILYTWQKYNVGILGFHYLVYGIYTSISNTVSLIFVDCLFIYGLCLGITLVLSKIPAIRKAVS